MDPVQAEAAVRQLIDLALQAWNAGNTQEFAHCFTAAGSCVLPDGNCRHGRTAIGRLRRATPPAQAGGTVVDIQEAEFTHPAPGLVIAVLEGVDRYPDQRRSVPWIGSAVAVQEPEGTWRAAALQVSLQAAAAAG